MGKAVYRTQDVALASGRLPGGRHAPHRAAETAAAETAALLLATAANAITLRCWDRTSPSW